MKRFAFWFLAAFVALAVIKHFRSHEERPRRDHESRRSVVAHRVSIKQVAGEPMFQIDGDNRHTYTLTQLNDRYKERLVFEFDEEERDANHARRWVDDDDLPVSIIAGSRVSEARPEPPAPVEPPAPPKAPKPPRKPKRAPKPKPTPKPEPIVETITVTGRLSATEERAKNDALDKLSSVLSERLAPDVPRSWPIPQEIARKMVLDTKVESHERDYGTVYDATLKVDTSPRFRAQIASAYHHEVVTKRLALLGGGLVFLLSCLGAVSTYIRADESTKGYYTNALRIASAAAVGATGVVIYQTLA